ncbi:MAG: hypothetical protein U0T81_16350 [Saprospiraceae bacterium]
MLLLIAAVILLQVLNEQSEMLIILTIVMVTGTAGYIQEFRAHRIVKNFRRSFPESVALSGVARKQK